MSCPDIFSITSQEPGTEIDPGTWEHLQTCPVCRFDLLVIGATKRAFKPQRGSREHLEHLNDLVIKRIAKLRIRRALVRPVDVWVTALLGALTIAAAVLATGGHLQPGATILELALVAAGGGAAAAGAQILVGRRDRALAVQQAART